MKKKGKDPILSLVGIAPGPSDASVNHDKYIYGKKKFSAVRIIQEKLQGVPEKELDETISEAIKWARAKKK